MNFSSGHRDKIGNAPFKRKSWNTFHRRICHDDPKSSEEKKPGFLVDDDDGSDVSESSVLKVKEGISKVYRYF